MGIITGELVHAQRANLPERHQPVMSAGSPIAGLVRFPRWIGQDGAVLRHYSSRLLLAVQSGCVQFKSEQSVLLFACLPLVVFLLADHLSAGAP